MTFADAIAGRPLLEHLLQETHALLMHGVRGQDKAPGGYRTDQNWIGAPDCAIEEAAFVPIAPEHLKGGMQAWAQYLNDTTQLNPSTAWPNRRARTSGRSGPFLALYERVQVDIIDVTRSQHGLRALDFIFRQPVFGSAQFVDASEIPRATAQRFITLWRDQACFTPRVRRGRRGGVYVFTELIEIVEGRSTS